MQVFASSLDGKVNILNMRSSEEEGNNLFYDCVEKRQPMSVRRLI